MYDIILSFITAFAISFVAIPSIINIAHKKGLIDEPGERTSHVDSVPTLGGIGIFAGMIFSVIMWTPFKYFADLQYILCAVIIIFLIGAKDDIDPMSPGKKMLGQLFAAFILVLKANIKLTSLYGIFGVYAIPEVWSVAISVFTIIVIINSFNLIDGINGLSGSIGTLIALVLGTWFFLVDHLELAILAYALAGSTVAFLKFNFTPAKIFMGDTGSLLLGLVCSILTISFIEFHQIIDSPYASIAAPSVAFGIMILPLFDTLRVFIMRILKGKSPFQPDRTHIHHLLIDAGMTHMQATGTLIMVNVLFIFIVIKLQGLGNMNLLLLILGLALILSSLLYYISSGKKRQQFKES
jgi:UDP-N-acetylmuramyl pentapeptide phosphotransferase/UDP-N-acetylglucosamine-1-phosphate transferase